MGRILTVEKQHINGENGHKYYHMMLNMADDDLNPREYRLLGHYLRWAGHGGTREEGIRETARICRMGQATVRKARTELAKKGYLKVEEPTPEQIKEGVPVKITVIDRWAENVTRYAKTEKTERAPVSEQIQGVSKQIQVNAETRIQTDTPPRIQTDTKEEQSLEEPSSEEQSIEKPEPAGESDNNITHRQKTDLIKAWWDALPELNRPDVDPSKMYSFPGYIKKAEAALAKGMTPAKFSYYIREVTGPRGFYHDKPLAFAAACEKAPPWCAVHYRPPQNKPAQEIVTEDDLDPRVLSALEQLTEALSA